MKRTLIRLTLWILVLMFSWSLGKDGALAAAESTLRAEETEFTLAQATGLTIPFEYYGSNFKKNVTVKITGKPLAYSMRCEENRAELFLEACEAGDSSIVISDKKSRKSKLQFTVHTEESAIPDNMLLEFTAIRLNRKSSGLTLDISIRNHSSRKTRQITYEADFRTKSGEQKFFSLQYDGVDFPGALAYWTKYFYIQPGEKGKDTLIPSIDFDGKRIKDKSITEVRCAIVQVTFDDGTVVYIPDDQLYWFSTKKGYLEKPAPRENYQVPSEDILNKAEKFDFGMETFYITSNTKAFYGLPEIGAYVSHVDPDSVAEKCGLQLKDLIIEADGLTYREDPYYMERAEAKIAEGESVSLKVLRNGNETVVITAQRIIPSVPEQEQAPTGTIEGKDGSETIQGPLGDIPLPLDRERTFYNLVYQYPEGMNFEAESESEKRHILRYHVDGFDPAAFGIIVSRRKGISSERWLADEIHIDISKTEINGVTWLFGETYSGDTKAIIYACDVGDYCYSVSFNSQHSDTFDFADFAWAFIRKIAVSP
ncbi:MAG: PDZ domain-containing protein [Eubacteriales bacterium]